MRQNIVLKFTSKIKVNKLIERIKLLRKNKQVEVVRIPSPILPRLFKEILEKSKFFKKKGNKIKKTANPKNRQSYAQVLALKVCGILKLKDNFPNLLNTKIKNIHNLINSFGKIKPRIKMTTKGLSRKQIIILISDKKKSKFIASSSIYITNLNRALKNIKSDIITNFV